MTFTGKWARSGAAALVAIGLALTSAAAPSSAATVKGAIGVKWSQLGGARSAVGLPTTDERAVPGGAYNHFQRGSIYWSPATGAHEIRGAIRGRWSAMGWERSYLRFPTTDERRLPTREGAYNHFQGGSVYWCPETGTHAIRGAIREKWASAGWEAGYLGCPSTDERAVRDGAYNHFERGSIYWTPREGAHIVRGAIRTAWARQGWETSRLGFPTSDELSIAGGRRTRFQGGMITWSPERGAQTAFTSPSTTYENCDAVRAAGAAPIYRGEPGYAPHLDGDGDGIGCEVT